MQKDKEDWKKELFLCLFFAITACFSIQAKKYHFDMTHTYNVEQIRVAQDQSRFLKVFAVGSNADKAIVQALQDAVACCIFMGIDAVRDGTIGHNATAVPALVEEGKAGYEKNKQYFKSFFTNGDFLQYVTNSNTRYPSGENNIKVRGGRRVGVYVQLHVKQLRQRLEKDGIIKSFDDIWEDIQQ